MSESVASPGTSKRSGGHDRKDHKPHFCSRCMPGKTLPTSSVHKGVTEVGAGVNKALKGQETPSTIAEVLLSELSISQPEGDEKRSRDVHPPNSIPAQLSYTFQSRLSSAGLRTCFTRRHLALRRLNPASALTHTLLSSFPATARNS
ncbi:hypothetical protein AOLI_G00165690 [Acnodon oligacanthus]